MREDIKAADPPGPYASDWGDWMAELCNLLVSLPRGDICRKQLRAHLNWLQGQEQLGVEYIRVREPRFLARMMGWSVPLFELEELLAELPADDPWRAKVAERVAWMQAARRWI